MKASEILRKLADVIDGQTSGEEQSASTEITNRPDQTAVNAPTDTASIEAQAGVDVSTMVPPLQAKLELLKKAVNVDSIYDQGGEDGDLTGQGADNEDPLDTMKKLSGINIVATAEAADDNDVVG
jgi:hypothetical protein